MYEQTYVEIGRYQLCINTTYIILFVILYSIYTNDQTKLACNSLKIINIFTALILGFFLMYILYCVCCCPCFLCYFCNTVRENRLRKNNNLAFATAFLDNYNPIPFPPSDIECSICLESAKEGDTDWVELECKHKFHIMCVTEWFKY